MASTTFRSSKRNDHAVELIERQRRNT